MENRGKSMLSPVEGGEKGRGRKTQSDDIPAAFLCHDSANKVGRLNCIELVRVLDLCRLTAHEYWTIFVEKWCSFRWPIDLIVSFSVRQTLLE